MLFLETSPLPVLLRCLRAVCFSVLCVYMSSLAWLCLGAADTEKAAYSSWSLLGPGLARRRAPGGLPDCHQQGFIGPED